MMEAQIKPAPPEMGVINDRDLKLRLLLRVLTDPELNLQRQAESDPWTYRDKDFTVKLYKDPKALNRAFNEWIPGAAKARGLDLKLVESYLESLRKVGVGSPGGFYDREGKVIHSPYDRDVLQHELEHHFYPEEQHPLFEDIEEYRKRRKKR